MKPLLLKPIGDKTIWGSNRISKIRGSNEFIGTWWEVSAHPYCTNEITNLDTKITLQQLIDENPDEILGPGYTIHEMLRLAYLDTQAALSIQVHPEDEYALKNAHDFGKYESWYILEASEQATLVAGTNIDDRQVIETSIKNNELKPYLQKWPVKKGDYIIIPAGMIHALGKDILALEIGTNSNTTYRFYDYGRTDKQGNLRQLHLKESFDVVDFTKQPTFIASKQESRCLADEPFYKVEEWYVDENKVVTLDECYGIISNVDSRACTILWQNEKITLAGYQSMFVPYSAKQVTILKDAHVLFSQPKKEKL